MNPYGPSTAKWTTYSFRPCDTCNATKNEPFPQISITPASFEAISSMNTMLNNIPYVVVKEYFFKNQANTMIDFVQKIAGTAKEIAQNVKDAMANEGKESGGAGSAKSVGSQFIAQVKDKFQNIRFDDAAVWIPYILYICLRNRTYGNTYVFPYIVDGGTLINGASNDAEWGNGETGGGLIE